LNTQSEKQQSYRSIEDKISELEQMLSTSWVTLRPFNYLTVFSLVAVTCIYLFTINYSNHG
jgi:hypothetical protein